MKKVILVLGVVLTLMVLVQSWLIGLWGTMFNDPLLTWSGRGGFLGALLLLAGTAFLLPRPLISFFIYLSGGLFGLAFGLFTGYYDAIMWGIFSLSLGGGSYYAWNLERGKLVIPEGASHAG